jgi:hypothetical protein
MGRSALPINKGFSSPHLLGFVFDQRWISTHDCCVFMRCPRCVRKIHRGADTCPRCGFSLVQADQSFSSELTQLPALADRAGLMRLVERNRVQKAMNRFRWRFPQLFFAVYTGVFRDDETMRCSGFWLLNRARFHDVDGLTNSSCILLIIDVERKCASMSFGYALDPYLDEEMTFRCLSKAHPHWLESCYDEGISALLSELYKILRRQSHFASKSPDRYAQSVLSPGDYESWKESFNTKAKNLLSPTTATDQES